MRLNKRNGTVYGKPEAGYARVEFRTNVRMNICTKILYTFDDKFICLGKHSHPAPFKFLITVVKNKDLTPIIIGKLNKHP